MIQVVSVVNVVRMISLNDMHSENKWFSWSRPAMSDRKAEQCSQFVGKEQSGALATGPDIIAVLLEGGSSRQIITEGGKNLREAVLRKALLRYKESGWRRSFPPTFVQTLRAFCCFIALLYKISQPHRNPIAGFCGLVIATDPQNLLIMRFKHNRTATKKNAIAHGWSKVNHQIIEKS